MGVFRDSPRRGTLHVPGNIKKPNLWGWAFSGVYADLLCRIHSPALFFELLMRVIGFNFHALEHRVDHIDHPF